MGCGADRLRRETQPAPANPDGSASHPSHPYADARAHAISYTITYCQPQPIQHTGASGSHHP
jgi:hypothetical protein